MKKLSLYIFLPCILVLMGSCSDLQEELNGEITTDINVPGISTTGGGSDVLGGAFGELRNAGTANHSSYYSVQEITSDEMCIAAKGGDWLDGGILVQLHKHTYTASHDFLNNAWNGSYNAINTVNELLGGDDLDDNQRAQAQVLRAYFYMRLLDLYGSVKIITEDADDAPQSSREEVFAFVEEEILEALGLQGSSVSPSMDLSSSALNTELNAYRINQYGALGILAKLYLNAEVYTGIPRYEEAGIAAGYIIDSGAYQLCGVGCSVTNLGKRPSVDADPDRLEGYAAVFAPNNENNPENIFTVEYDEVVGTGMNFSQMNLHYSSQFTWNLNEQPWNGYATLEEFYNSYDDNDLRKKASFIVGPQLDFSGTDLLDYASDDDGIQLNYTPTINEIQPNSLREAGARAGKFSFKQLGRADMDNDYPIVRLGEMYLVRAEATARVAGDWNAGASDVNIIRARAGVEEYMGSLTEEEFLAERGREMFQEGQRRTDLIRFGRYNDAWWEKDASPEHVNIFPIPADQIIASEGTLTQNPGY